MAKVVSALASGIDFGSYISRSCCDTLNAVISIHIGVCRLWNGGKEG